MSRREEVDNVIWSDPDFCELSPHAKLTYLWSFTNPRCGMAGLYKCALGPAAAELGLSLEELNGALTDLSDARFVAFEEHVMWVRTRVKHLRSRSPKIAIAIANDLEKIAGDHPLKARFLDKYEDLPWLRDALRNTSSERTQQPTHRVSENLVDKGNLDTVSERSADLPISGIGEHSFGEGMGGAGGKDTDAPVEPVERVELPDGFPMQIRSSLRATYRTLTALAERHNAKQVNAVSLASIAMANSHKPLAKAALECAAHWDAQPAGVKDVLAAYRNWLKRVDDLAGYEQLDDNGMPITGRAPFPTAARISRGVRGGKYDQAAGLNR